MFPLGIVHLLILGAAWEWGGVAGQDLWFLQLSVLIGLSFIIAFWVYSQVPRISFLYPMICQLFCLVVAHYLYGNQPLLTSLFVMIPTLEFLYWYRYRLSIVVLLQLGIILLLSLHSFFSNTWRTDPRFSLEMALSICLSTGAAYGVSRLRQLAGITVLQKKEIDSLRHSVDRLLNANLDFQDYAVKVGETSVIQERQRLSRDIHDVVGYTLTNLRMMLEHAIALAENRDQAQKENSRLALLLSEALEELLSGMQETRIILRQFREIENSTVEGIPYMQKLVKTFSHATGIEVNVDYGNLPWVLPSDITPVLYRLIQESMTNAFRHGRASKVRIRFWIAFQKLTLKVDDNGKGSLGLIQPGIGMAGMHERLTPLGGTMESQSGAAGFSLSVEIPFADKMGEDENVQ